ncbi:cytochrome P450 [Thozetella sp. PMI_491]|nr:cytochrome P450 [Thozetella sp. PMI_491]
MVTHVPVDLLGSNYGLARNTLVALPIIGIVWFLVRLYNVRTKFRRLQREHGIPILPHSFILGHILVFAKVAIKYKTPRDAAGFWQFHFLQKEYPELASAGLFYIDTWPIAYPMIVVFNPDMLNQFTQVQSQPKWWNGNQNNFKHFTGGRDLVTLDGQEWKMARAAFNPGFSAANLLSIIPQLLEEALVFRERLQSLAATGEVVTFENYTIGLTVDMIGRVVLGTRFLHQREDTKLMKALWKQVALLYFSIRPLVQVDPTRHIRHWIYRRQIRTELSPLIEDAARNHDNIEGPKTILSQAIAAYRKNNPQLLHSESMSPAFKEDIINHIKMFLFAGHDTTGSTLASVFYLLSIHPDEAAKVCAEHDLVLGTDPKEAAERIRSDPITLNRMPYTNAVVKETLRIMPPVAGGTREPYPGFMLVNPTTGKQYPTNGFMVLSSITTVSRDPEYWPEADRFLPARWLVTDQSDPYYPVKGTWRPFEAGPRNCIGQELALLELRLALALTVREFRIQDMYREDEPTLFGIKGYQVDSSSLVTAHLKRGLPCKVLAR